MIALPRPQNIEGLMVKQRNPRLPVRVTLRPTQACQEHPIGPAMRCMRTRIARLLRQLPGIDRLHQHGVAGIGLFAFIMGWRVPRATYQEAQTQRDDWKAMYEHERDSHQATRDAMLLASQRADAGVEAAPVAKIFLEAVYSRQSLPGRDKS